MGKFLCLTRKETGDLFRNSPVLLATAFLVLLDSFAFYLTATRQAVVHAVFDDMAIFMLFTSILLYPLVTMHSFASENAHGTLETLLTAPVGSLTTVLAKFSGAMIYTAVYFLHGVVFALLLSSGGNLDWPATGAAFLALIAVGAVCVSLGILISANSISATAAAAGTFGVLVFLALASDVDPYSGSIANLIYSMSFVPHAKRFIAGEIDTRGLVYFISVTVLLLFYTWLSLASLAPEKLRSNPVSRRRMRITYLLGLLGFVFLLLQAAILHINGFWESPTPMGPALARVPQHWLIPLGLAAVCLLWSIFTHRAARRAERLHRRRHLRYATISETRVMGASRFFYDESLRQHRRAVVTVIAGLVIVLNLNWLSHYPFRTFSDSGWLRPLAMLRQHKWDVSENKRNSLSPTTQRVLDSLQGRVLVYSFLTDEGGKDGVPVAAETRRLLERYADHNGLVAPTYADSKREPELLSGLAADLGIPVEELGDTLVVEYQGRRISIPESTLASLPDWMAKGGEGPAWVFDGENRITQAIMRLSDPRVPNVFFTAGHQEMGFTGPYAERTASTLVRRLTAANMRVRQYTLNLAHPIPPECDILVVASPRVLLNEMEVEQIRDYLASGGRMMALGSPVVMDDFAETSSFNHFLFNLGGSFRDELATDGSGESGDIVAAGYVRGAGGETLPCYFAQARTIRDNPRAAEGGWVVERVVESGLDSQGINIATGEERAGPFTLLFRSRKMLGTGEARAVVVGSGRMGADSDIGRGGNSVLLMNMMQWLAGREETRDIAPKVWIDRRLNMVGPHFRAILWIGVVALPLLWLIAGVTAWWLRRE